MNFSIQSKNLSQIELQYAELKKQSVIDQNESRGKKGLRERKASEITDEVTLSPSTDEATKLKPSLPVTHEEIQALRTLLSVYA